MVKKLRLYIFILFCLPKSSFFSAELRLGFTESGSWAGGDPWASAGEVFGFSLRSFGAENRKLSAALALFGGKSQRSGARALLSISLLFFSASEIKLAQALCLPLVLIKAFPSLFKVRIFSPSA